ncbi:hypothetical protein ABZ721_12075 [Streptomyces sp. NPDC006733]|uniref:hypothetical protein n=1 Tax=Streptomyces sp. NPDC006733 TaxID=3155460 RepID=UPI0033F83E33
MRKSTAAPLLLAAALLAAGCAPDHSTTADSAAAPTPPGHSGQSLWHVIDADGKTITQLPDDDPVVTVVRKTVVLHSGAVDNRAYRTIADSAAQEFAFYNADFADALRAQHYDAGLADLFTTNHLATHQTDIAWYQSTFPKDMKTAKVEMDSTIEFTAADQSYLDTNKFELHRPYTQHRTVSLALAHGKWAIVAIEKGRLTRQAPTLPKPTTSPS